MVTAVAAVSFLFLRTLLSWQLALAACALVVTFIFRATPNLTYNTLAMGMLTLGFALGLWVVMWGKGWRFAAAAGLCHGLAVLAFPTLLFVMPFIIILFVVAQGREARAFVARLTWRDPRPEDGPTGPRAFQTLGAYSAGGLLPGVAVAVIAFLAGPENVQRCWRFTLQAARNLNQLAGAAKAVEVTVGLARFVAAQWSLVLALVVVYVLYRWRPRLGRGLLVLLPIALYAAGRHAGAGAAGMIIVYGLLAPYLYAMLPPARREAGAAVLVWVWPSAVIAAAMTAYTSAEGYPHAAVGLFPAALVSGLFLAWAVLAAFDGDDDGRMPTRAARRGARRRGRDLACVRGAGRDRRGECGVQFQYQAGGVQYEQLSVRLDDGPWRGVRVTRAQSMMLSQYEDDLKAQARPGDALLVLFREPGLYLYWPYGVAADSASLQGHAAGGQQARLPASTIAFYRRTHRLPDLVVRVAPAAGSDSEALGAWNGLGYPVVVPLAASTRSASARRGEHAGDPERAAPSGLRRPWSRLTEVSRESGATAVRDEAARGLCSRASVVR
jgi:hypothetical protein